MNPPTPQEAEIDAFIRDITKVHAINGGFLVKSETRERLKVLLLSQAQGLVKEMMTAYPMKDPMGCMEECCKDKTCRLCVLSEGRSALLEWANSKNLV